MINPKIFSVSVMILGLALGAISCTGYADGPALSLASAKKKIAANAWKVKEAASGTTDITADFDGDSWTFNEGGTFRYTDASRMIDLPPFTQEVNTSVDGNGTWEFVNDLSTMEVFYTNSITDPYNSSVVYDEAVNEIWEVTRLTKEELWIRDGDIFLKLIPR